MPYVFMYGPDSLQGRVYDRLGPSDVMGGAMIEGYALTFDKPPMSGTHGLANLKKTPGESAFGVLYDLTRKQIETLGGYYGGYSVDDITVSLLPLPEGVEMEPELLARRPKGPVKAQVFIARRTKAGLAPEPAALTATLQGATENGAPEAFTKMLGALKS
jgi:hypothetical protein